MPKFNLIYARRFQRGRVMPAAHNAARRWTLTSRQCLILRASVTHEPARLVLLTLRRFPPHRDRRIHGAARLGHRFGSATL